jgi:hypothetical protein
MATKNNGITRADAIAFAYDVIFNITEGDGFASDEDNGKAAEALPILKKMHEQLTAPRKATVSKARKVNENLATKVHAAIVEHGDGMSTKDIVALGIPEITTTQKAAAVARVACELGLLHKCVDGKSITYAIA